MVALRYGRPSLWRAVTQRIWYIIQCKHKQRWRHDDEIDDLRKMFVLFASRELVITISWSRVHQINGMQHKVAIYTVALYSFFRSTFAFVPLSPSPPSILRPFRLKPHLPTFDMIVYVYYRLVPEILRKALAYKFLSSMFMFIVYHRLWLIYRKSVSRAIFSCRL